MTQTRFVSILALALFIVAAPVVSVKAASPHAVKEVRAVWIWGSTVRALGPEIAANQLHERGITDAILLVKGTAGTVAYPSAIAPAAADVDTLGQFLAACHERGIKVHAWLNYHQDDYFGKTKTNRKYTLWGVGKFPAVPAPLAADGRICPLQAKKEYNDYFLSIVQEVLANYAVDGIHLDYIRYPHIVYCFCPDHVELAEKNGIDIGHIRDLINQTYYVPKDDKTYFNALAAGDSDVVKWVGLRVAEIDGMVEAVRNAIDTYNAAHGTSVALSAALMPEGALSDMYTDQARNDQFALCHYSQSYEHFSPMMQFIAPMAYHKDYGEPPAWVGDVVAGAVSKAGGTPVLGGIQTYNVTADAILSALTAARWNGAAGFALFRHGTGDKMSVALVPTLKVLSVSTKAAWFDAWIDNGGIYASLAQKLRNTESAIDASEFGLARELISAYVNELAAQSGKHVDEREARILSFDAQWIADLLP